MCVRHVKYNDYLLTTYKLNATFFQSQVPIPTA